MTHELTNTTLSRHSSTERLIWSLATGVVTALTGCASTDPRTSPSDFAALDTKRDNKVSQAEYVQSKIRRTFDKLDRNGDRKITLDEWQRLDRSPQAREHFEALDENGDEYITVAEFLELAPKHSNLDETFTTPDEDADKSLTLDEMKEEPAVKLFSLSF